VLEERKNAKRELSDVVLTKLVDKPRKTEGVAIIMKMPEPTTV